MSTTIRMRSARIAIATALTLGVTAGGMALQAGPASAAAQGFIAAPNGLVGLTETVTIYAPNAKGQTVTVGLQVGASQSTLQTAIGSNGYGAVTWTPASAGTWTFSGLGVIAGVTSTATVAPAPTYTVLLAQNNVQQGANNSLLAAVVSPLSSLAPTGTITLVSGQQAVGNAALTGSYGSNASTANVNWVPGAPGNIDISASYTPASGGQLASTSAVSSPDSTPVVTNVSMRWPTNLYVGTTAPLQAVLGAGLPDGTVAWQMDGQGISGSIPTTNGVATLWWAPPSSGTHTISVQYSGAKPGASGPQWYSGTSTQMVVVNSARVADNITVDPVGQPVWQIAQPIVMRAGSSVTLAGTSQSGTPVVFSEQGPCVIAGAVLKALSAGQCQVTAQSPGTGQLLPGNETYTITIQAPPTKKPR